MGVTYSLRPSTRQDDKRMISEDKISTFAHGHYCSTTQLEELINYINKKYES